MPYADDRAARLFYDDACGPCRLLAHASEGLSRHRLVATPLTAPEAEARLVGLPAEVRYGYAHLDTGPAIRTGEDLAAPLVGLALGPTWQRVVQRHPPLERALRRIYVQFWEYRRTRGCAAPRAG